MRQLQSAGRRSGEYPQRNLFYVKCKEVFAMFKEIEIKDKAQVEKINRLACDAPYEVWLSSGDMMLDARSLLGLFAMVGRRAHVVVEDDVPSGSFDRMVAKMA